MARIIFLCTSGEQVLVCGKTVFVVQNNLLVSHLSTCCMYVSDIFWKLLEVLS